MYTFFHHTGEIYDAVLENLNRYASLINHGIPSAFDRVPSTTTSLIKVNTDQVHPLNLGEKIVNAITDEQEDNVFIRKYTSIINSLPELEREVIIYRYINQYTFSQIMEGYKGINVISHPTMYIDRAFTNIALLDEDIPFTVDDYIEIKSKNNNLKNKYSIYKKTTLIYLQQYKNQNNKMNADSSNIDLDEMEKSLKCIAEVDKKWLLSYAFKEKSNYTPDQYIRIRRGILSFVYANHEFDCSDEEYLEAMKLTGRGWQKSYNYVQKKKKEIFGEHSYENDQI